MNSFSNWLQCRNSAGTVATCVCLSCSFQPNAVSIRTSSSKYGIWAGNLASGECVSILSHLGLIYLSRPYWRCYFPNTSAIIYVIDSSDHSRLQTSRSELLTMLSEEELVGVPLLVFCNKQDVEGALKPEEISEQLGLAGGEKGRDWSVRGSCAVKGEGIEEGLDWCVMGQYCRSRPSLK